MGHLFPWMLQIRSLEQRIREREAQLRSSSSASLLGGLRRHSAQQRETPSPSGSTQYLGSGTSPSSTAPSPSGSSLPASAVRPYARGLQDLVNSTRNMPSIVSGNCNDPFLHTCALDFLAQS